MGGVSELLEARRTSSLPQPPTWSARPHLLPPSFLIKRILFRNPRAILLPPAPPSGQIGDITPAVKGPPTLQSGQQNETWPTSGQIGYITPALSGVPNTSQQGTK